MLKRTTITPALLIAIIAILLTLFSHQRSSAQGYSYWAVTGPVPNSGTVTQDGGAPYNWSGESYNGFEAEPSSTENSISMSGTVGPITLTWCPGNGSPTSPPAMQQQYLPVLVTLDVSGWVAEDGPVLPASWTLNDGYGDSSTAMSGYGSGEQSYGKHLIQAPVTDSGGTWTATVPVDTLSGSGTDPLFPLEMAMSLFAEPDTRSVTITAGTSAKVPQTDTGLVTDGNPTWPLIEDQYQNVQYQPGPEPIGAGAATNGDFGLDDYNEILENDITTKFTYVANATGNWHMAGATDNWFSSLHQAGQTVTLTSPSDAIPSFTVGYVNPDPGDNSSGDISGPKDHIHLTLMDGTGSDGASASANLYVTLHPLVEASLINGPTAQLDPNFYSFIVAPQAWPGGQPTNDTLMQTVDSPSAAYESQVLNGGSLACTAISAATFCAQPFSAICGVIGVGLDAINQGIDSSGQISRDLLWPSYSYYGYYPNQWSANGPTEYPTNAGAPADFKAQCANPSYVSEQCTCNPYEISTYENSLYDIDTWGPAGYASYGEQLFGKWHDTKTIGVWTYVSRNGNR
jgi:hypothetical protein